MKLYTEAQVMEMLRIAKHTYELIDNIMNEFNEIELPTDEEVEERKGFEYPSIQQDAFVSGAKWYREQLKLKGGEQ